MEILLKDLVFAFRVNAKSAVFSLLAVLTLALGIGASTAVFSVVNAILIKPLPFPDPGRILVPWRVAPISDSFAQQYPWNKRDFQIFQRETKTFQSLGAFQADRFNFTGFGEPQRWDGIRVSAGFFPVLGASPAIGRSFTPEEDQPGREYEVILSDRLWRERFGGDPGILGRSVQLNGFAYSVIGVMPAGFSFPRAGGMPDYLDLPEEPQLWVPLAIPPAPSGPDDIAVIGRIRPDAGGSQVQAELDVFARRLDIQFPEAKGWHNSRVVPLARQVVGDTRRPLLLMLGAVTVVLLIACSNIANLLLTRSISRVKEFTLRAALGAGRFRLVRQLLTESLVLAAAGGLAGILIAGGAIHFLRILGPPALPRLRELQIDGLVGLFAVVVTFATSIVFGAAPALVAARTRLAEALREGTQRSGGSSSGSRIRNVLLVGEVALALVLVIAAGLMVRTFYGMLGSNTGFQAQHVLTFELSLPVSKYPDSDRMARLYASVLSALESVPGAHAAGLVSFLPLGGAPDNTVIRIPEHPVQNEKEKPSANYAFASRGYFQALGTPLLRGRDFLDTDTLGSMPVTIVNNAMARKYWPGENPIGKQVGVASKKWPARTIVGVVADVKQMSLREDPAPGMFVPFTQNEIKVWPSMQTMQVAVRANGDPQSLIQSVRKAVGAVDPSLPLAKVSTLTTLVDNSLTQPRFAMLLLVSFGGLAMVLACIGMYGVISYGVAQRTREIGIRIALGAQRADVFRMLLAQGAGLVGTGIAIGLLAAFAVTRLMSSFLYGVRANDPLTFAAVSLLLAGVGFAASVMPASRATRIDPVIAMRFD